MTFKTQAEIFQALLNSKTLLYKNHVEVKLVDGMIHSERVSSNNLCVYDLDFPEDWSIKKEPMVLWCNTYDDQNGEPVFFNHRTKMSAVEDFNSSDKTGRTVKFIEVEEE